MEGAAHHPCLFSRGAVFFDESELGELLPDLGQVFLPEGNIQRGGDGFQVEYLCPGFSGQPLQGFRCALQLVVAFKIADGIFLGA